MAAQRKNETYEEFRLRVNAYSRARYAADPEKFNAAVRRFKEAHRDEYLVRKREAAARYREENREVLREKHRAYTEANREKINARNLEYSKKEEVRLRQRVLARERYNADLDKARKKVLAWRADNPGANRKSQTGWSNDMVAEALVSQNGICAIEGCSNPVQCADHCHAPDYTRALLCMRCNVMLAAFEHPLTEGFKSYLQHHKELYDLGIPVIRRKAA